KEPEVKINPARKNRYEVTVNIKDAPGGFEFAEGRELYYAKNCKYTTNRMMGATANPHFDQIVPLTKVGGTTYQGVFYTDSPLNEDYYGQGVCKWENIGISMEFKASNKDNRDTRFSPSINFPVLQEISLENPSNKFVFYYFKNDYPFADFMSSKDINESGFSFTGLTLQEIKKRNLKEEDFFSIEVDIKKVEK
uniref:hypothetical protein n=1 Tax=Neisseria dentiae TaxID=194197 RepID=UPI0035A104E7